MIKSNYPVEYFNSKRSGKFPHGSIGIDCMNENEAPANAAVVPSDSRSKQRDLSDQCKVKPSGEGLIMAVNDLNNSVDAEDSQNHHQYDDGEVDVDEGQNEPEDLALSGNDSSQSPQISPSLANANGQIPAMPLCSITNKLINGKPFDFGYNTGNFNYHNYYNNSVSLTPSSLNSSAYENHHFSNNGNPYSASSFGCALNNNGNHGQHQQQSSSQFANSSFQNQLNQYNQSNVNPLAYLNSQAHHQSQLGNQQRVTGNNRVSTGSSSSDTSSTSLSSPPLSSGSENVSPLMANQMMIPGANAVSSQLSKYYNSPFNPNLLKSNASVTATPISANNSTSSSTNSSILSSSSSIRTAVPAMMPNNQDGGDGALPLKKRRPVPSEYKDQSYWEKRRKNNESAKRSRDMRRSKEEHISMRVVYLENENLHLRTECSMLRKEVEQLRAMLYANQNVNNINH